MKSVPWIIIIVLMLVIFFQRECHRCPELPPLQSDSLVVRDTIPIAYPAIKPKPPKIEYVQLPAHIDTAAILQDYFARVQGNDTIANDSSVLVVIDWLLTQNRLLSMQPTITNRRPTTIISHTMTPKLRNKYFVGLGVGRSPQQFGLAASVALVTKKDNLYTLSYDALNKDAYVGVYWKIR